jgi:hypothetical protein
MLFNLHMHPPLLVIRVLTKLTRMSPSTFIAEDEVYIEWLVVECVTPTNAKRWKLFLIFGLLQPVSTNFFPPIELI